jgi:hypothetical protein
MMHFDSSLLFWLVGAVFVAYKVVYRCLLLRAKKERFIFTLKKMGVFLFSYGAAVVYLQNSGHDLSTIEIAVLSALAGIGVSYLLVRNPRRSRHIPMHVKYQVIERHLKNGGKFDPALQHIDHIVPYSEGGDHSVRNLRIISSEANLAKAAKRPKLRDFLKRGA